MDQWPRKWGLISIMDINKFNEIYFQIIFLFNVILVLKK